MFKRVLRIGKEWLSLSLQFSIYAAIIGFIVSVGYFLFGGEDAFVYDKYVYFVDENKEIRRGFIGASLNDAGKIDAYYEDQIRGNNARLLLSEFDFVPPDSTVYILDTIGGRFMKIKYKKTIRRGHDIIVKREGYIPFSILHEFPPFVENEKSKREPR